MQERYTQKKQYFMNQEVIIIETYREVEDEAQNQWIPIQHFFKGLERLRSNGQVQAPDRDKLIEFITDDLEEEAATKTFSIRQKDSTGRENPQDMDCIRLDVLAIAVTQFKPTTRKGTKALIIWRAYMRWINSLLKDCHAHELIIREEQIENLEYELDYASKYMVKGRTLNDIVYATGQNRCKIETYCLDENWYCKHNNDVWIKRDDLVVRTRKGAVEFTEKGMDILLEVFKETQKILFYS